MPQGIKPFVTYFISTGSSLLIMNGDITPKGATELIQMSTIFIGGISFIITQVWMFTHHTETTKAQIAQQGKKDAAIPTNTPAPNTP